MPSILKRLVPLFLALGFTSAAHADAGGQPGSELAGRYRLDGAGEVSSELLLRENGRFQWSMTYGADAREADGEWSFQAGVITLTPRRWAAPVNARMAEVLPWDEHANEMHATRLREREQEAFRERCPIAVLQREAGSVMSDAVYAPPPTREDLMRTKRAADAAREEAQAIIDQLVARPEWARDPRLVAEIGRVLGAHADAEMRREHTSDSARVAGMAVPAAPAPLVFPPDCRRDEPEATTETGRGAVVAVFDPERRSTARGFTVTAEYDQGPPVRERLGPRGLAYFPLDSGRRVVALTLATSDGAMAENERRFPVTITAPAVHLIHVDLLSTEAPFDQWQLTVEAEGTLRPLMGLEGHYARIDP